MYYAGYICIHARCLKLELECIIIYVMHVGCMLFYTYMQYASGIHRPEFCPHCTESFIYQQTGIEYDATYTHAS